jgi:hypothetical protein
MAKLGHKCSAAVSPGANYPEAGNLLLIIGLVTGKNPL